MKKLYLILFSGLQIWTASAQSSSRSPLYMQKSLSGLGIQQVEAQTSGGNISVTGVADKEARLEVYVRGSHDEELSSEEIKKRLEDQFEFSITTDDHKVRAIARPKRDHINWNRSLSISFKIYTPEAVSSVLRTSGGNISLKKLSGATQDFKTSGGDMDIDQVTGKLNGRTSGGNINISDAKDDIDLGTSGGNIEATHCEGNLRFVTSGGDLKLRLLKGTTRAVTSGGTIRGEVIEGDLAAKTSGGNIKFTDLSCSLTGVTSGGDINVSFKELGKYLDLRNSSGDVTVALPQGKGMDLQVSADRVKANTLNNFKGKFDEKHIDGSLNGGGIPVKIDNSGGDVTLNFK